MTLARALDSVKNTTCRIRLLTLALAAVAAGTAHAQPPPQQTVQIFFDGERCPTRVSAPSVQAQRGSRIVWQAVDQQGNSTSESFRLYFDPLQGGSPHAGNGSVSRPIDMRAPTVEYKYTVVGDNCPQRPLDPVIRVY